MDPSVIASSSNLLALATVIAVVGTLIPTRAGFRDRLPLFFVTVAVGAAFLLSLLIRFAR